MKVKLIPIIELGYNNQGIKPPTAYPYSNNQEIWFEYRNASLQKADFKDEFEPYLKGSPFYEPAKITNRNLEKIVVDNTEEFINGIYGRDQVCCFFGGFVLKVNGADKFFPQCCGDLSDLMYWEKISQGQHAAYEGHPAPVYKFSSNQVILDFTVGEYDEHFIPTPPDTKLEINLEDLNLAVTNAKITLNKLAERVIKINQKLNLGIESIDDLLIWGDGNRN